MVVSFIIIIIATKVVMKIFLKEVLFLSKQKY